MEEKNTVLITLENGLEFEIDKDFYNSTTAFKLLMVMSDPEAKGSIEQVVASEKLINAMLGKEQMQKLVDACPVKEDYFSARNEIMAKYNEVKKK